MQPSTAAETHREETWKVAPQPPPETDISPSCDSLQASDETQPRGKLSGDNQLTPFLLSPAPTCSPSDLFLGGAGKQNL